MAAEILRNLAASLSGLSAGLALMVAIAVFRLRRSADRRLAPQAIALAIAHITIAMLLSSWLFTLHQVLPINVSIAIVAGAYAVSAAALVALLHRLSRWQR